MSIAIATNHQEKINRYYQLDGMLTMAFKFAKSDEAKQLFVELPYKNALLYGEFVGPILKEQQQIREELSMTDCQIMNCKGCPDCGPSLIDESIAD